jgi:phenylacetate-CoA ligase
LVKPPLKIVMEFGNGSPDLVELKENVEAKIRSLLNVQARVELVAPGTLPRFEMKEQLVQRP